MPATPSSASTANHSSITGPNTRPTRPVPKRCATKSPRRISRVSGMTTCSKALDTTFRPSTADSTEIAGVITLSP